MIVKVVRRLFASRLFCGRHVTVVLFPRVGRYLVGVEHNLVADSVDVLLLVAWVRIHKESLANLAWHLRSYFRRIAERARGVLR